jgi:uncharacterized protein (DUF885 family)
VAELVIQQIQAQLKQDAEHTELLKSFRAFPAAIPRTEQERLRREALEAYNQKFLPTWQKLLDYMAASYLPHVRSSDSVSSVKGGKAAYVILIHRLTTTTMSPADIHKLGEREVARIEAAMMAIIKESGSRGSIADYQKSLDADPAQHFHSKEEMLANSRNIAKVIEPELPNQFRHIPALLFGVRAIPPDREAASATNAQGSSPDLSTPGWFNLNTYQPERQVRYDQEALVLHEAIPGHIFQGSVARQQIQLPDLRRFYSNSAFGEGWALYAESLGAQLGVLRTPPAGSASSLVKTSVRFVSSLTRESTISGGPANRRLTISHSIVRRPRSPKSIVTSPGRHRRCPTSWVNYAFARSALKPNNSWELSSKYATSTTR